VIFSPKIIKNYQIVCTRETKVPNFLSKKLQNLLGKTKKKTLGTQKNIIFYFYFFMVTSVVGTEKYKLLLGFNYCELYVQWLIDCKHNYRQTMGQHGLYVTRSTIFILFYF
jgi:hypothetical protein